MGRRNKSDTEYELTASNTANPPDAQSLFGFHMHVARWHEVAPAAAEAMRGVELIRSAHYFSDTTLPDSSRLYTSD